MDWNAIERIMLDGEAVSVQLVGQQWCRASCIDGKSIHVRLNGMWAVLCDTLLVLDGPRKGERVYRAVDLEACPLFDNSVQSVG